MAERRVTNREMIAAVRAGRARGIAGSEIARQLGYSGEAPARQRYARILRAAVADGRELPPWPTYHEGIAAREEAREKVSLSETAARLKIAEAELKQLRKTADQASVLHQLIHDVRATPREPPRWLLERASKTHRWHHGTPTLFLSDLHWGERVFAPQVNHVNAYDLDIAHARLKRVVETSVVLLRDVLARGDYDGFVLALGGDMVSGNIHEELRETNCLPINAAVLDLLDHLIWAIDTLKGEFGRVYVPCVTGNHGRLDKKPRAKNAVLDNFEWTLYQFLARHYRNDDAVTVQVPESADVLYAVQGRRYLLTHGDQFHGGSGISGPLVPWSLGDARKRKRQNAIQQPYDTMIMGHWHSLTWGPGNTWIVNGSLKGYDEYAFRSNFGFEPPQQALWVTHPKHGITYKMDVRADGDSAAKSKAKAP